MERFCGHLKHGGTASKRFPYKSLDRYLLDWAVLWHLGTIYGLRETLQLRRHRADSRKFPVWGCKFKVPSCTFVHLRSRADEGYFLTSPQPQSNSPALDDDFVSQLVYNIMARLQNLPIHPYRVWAALKGATFYEWRSFTRTNPQETFYAASQLSKKAGARNSLYARVRPPPNLTHLSLTYPLSTKSLMPASLFHMRPRHAMDACKRSYRLHLARATKTFA